MQSYPLIGILRVLPTTVWLTPIRVQLPKGGNRRLDRNSATVNGEELVVERVGGQTYLYLKIAGGDTLVVQTHGDNSSQLRDLVPVHISGDLCHLFDIQGEAVLKTRRHPLTVSK